MILCIRKPHLPTCSRSVVSCPIGWNLNFGDDFLETCAVFGKLLGQRPDTERRYSMKNMTTKEVIQMLERCIALFDEMPREEAITEATRIIRDAEGVKQ